MTGPARQLRALNQPRPARVSTDGRGTPEVLLWKGRSRRIEGVVEQWRIDDEWWRRPISRRYVRVTLETGVLVTLYHDLEEDRWYLQDA